MEKLSADPLHNGTPLKLTDCLSHSSVSHDAARRRGGCAELIRRSETVCLAGKPTLSLPIARSATAFRLDVVPCQPARTFFLRPLALIIPFPRIIIKCSLISGRTPIGRRARRARERGWESVSTHEKPNNGRPPRTWG